jgi:hypothetical protein
MSGCVEPLRECGGSAERTKFIPKMPFVKASLGLVDLLPRSDERSRWDPRRHRKSSPAKMKFAFDLEFQAQKPTSRYQSGQLPRSPFPGKPTPCPALRIAYRPECCELVCRAFGALSSAIASA